ncbi:MAG: hypothetical protein ACI8QC_002618, partial [Planctomycetota bacterium]
AQEPAPLPALEQERAADIDELFLRFSRMQGLQANFVEKKYLALLALPLKSTGRLYFLPPNYLTRVVDTPTKSKLSITPTELRMRDPNGDEVLDLRQNPELRAFVTSLVRVFAGDRKHLEKSYAITYAHDAEHKTKWSLTLRPLAKPLTEMVRYLRLDGSGAAVLRIEIREPNGDRTVTSIADADPTRAFTGPEKLELFGIEASASTEEKKR